MVLVRKMEASEADFVKKIAQKAFVGIERVFVSKPKEAMVAVLDGSIVGAILIQYITSQQGKIGYYDFAFVSPEYHGQGIGKILYERTRQYLWDQGCTALSATVKDDNVASWNLLLHNGFQRVTLLEGVRQLGLSGMLKQYFTTTVMISNGAELYLAVKDAKIERKGGHTAQNLAAYFLANIALILPTFLISNKNMALFLSAYLLVLLGTTLFGYLGTLLSKERWKFRLNNGGGVIVAFIGLLGAAYPLIGNWYPPSYENTVEFRKSMGMTAACEWVFTLLVGAVCFSLSHSSVFFHYAALLSIQFLLYKLIPIYPFESYGGGRVYRWSKKVFAAFGGCSLFFIIWFCFF